MSALLDAPTPKQDDDSKKKKKSKKGKKKEGLSKPSSSAGDLLGLEDSADIAVGGADVSMDQSSEFGGSNTYGTGTAAATMDALSKITGDTVGRGGGGTSLDQEDSFDLDDMLPGGGSSNPKLSKTTSAPSGGGTSKASDTTTKSSYTPVA